MKDDLLHKRYAAIIAYSPSIGKDKVDLEIEKFKGIIETMGGKIEQFEYLGIKNLAYAIKKNNQAHYVQLYFNLLNDKNLKDNLQKLNRISDNKMNPNILRHMIIKIEHHDFNFKNLKNFEGFEQNMKF